MIPITAIASIAVFIGVLWLSGAARAGAGAVATARGALAIMRDRGLDDAARERAIQRASVQLFGAFASILARSAVTLLASIVPIWLADVLGLASMDDVVGFLSRWDVIVIASVVLTLGYVLWKKLRRRG